jgi:hypothetical protein
MPRLVAIEADRVDQPLDLGHGQPRHRPGSARAAEQARRRGVRGRVLGARRQQRRDEDLKGILGLGLGDLLNRRQLHAGNGECERAHHALYAPRIEFLHRHDA